MAGTKMVTFETLDGTVYTVNGSSKGDGFRDIKDIWPPDPKFPPTWGLRVNIGPLIELGLKLCPQ
jgi:hypothetical protein